jgi:hypothetical protein
MAAAAGLPALSAQQVQPNEQAKKDRLAKLTEEVMSKMVAQLNACPVGFRAEVDPRLTLRDVKNGKKDADSTFLRVIFEPTDAKTTIVSASVTAHGVAPHGQLMLVGQSADENRTQAFELTRGTGTAGLVQKEIEVTAVPFVRWVELNQITYADGSVWHAAEGTTCKSVLSKFHPV